MKRNLRFTLAALPLAGLLALPAIGGPGGPGPGFHPVRAALRQLDLTDQQKEQVKAAFQASRPNLQKLRDTMRADHDTLNGLVTAPTRDYAAIGKAFATVHDDREALKAERQKLQAAIQSVLTPEQKAKLDGFGHGFRMGRRGGSGGPGGGPGF